MSERDMARWEALAHCTLFVACLFILWFNIEMGILEELTYWLGPREGPAKSLFASFGEWGLLPLVGLALFITLLFDARAICYRRPNHTGRVPQPADDWEGYVRFRLRRYLLIPVVLGWLLLFCRVLVLPVTPIAAGGFAVAFLLSRRDEHSTYGTVLATLVHGAGEFGKGFSGR